MRIFNIIIFTALILFYSTEGVGQDQKTAAYSLQQAIEYALANNTEIKVADLDVDYARKQVMETSAIGLPQVNGSLNYQNFIDIPTQISPADAFSFPPEINDIIAAVAADKGLPLPMGSPGDVLELQFGTEHNSTVSITANQMVFNGSYIIGLKAARVYVELSRKNLQQTEKDVRHNVAIAYYTALIASESYGILQKNLENLKKIHFEATQLYENGFAEKLDVDRLTLSLSNVQTQLSNVERQMKVSTLLLKFHMGMSLNKSIMLSDSLGSMFAEDAIMEVPKVEFNNRIDYQQMKMQEQLAILNLKRYRFNQMPSIGAFFTHSQNAYRDKFNFFDNDLKWYPTTVVGLQLNVPIFGLQNSALVQQAKINISKFGLQKKRLEEAIMLEVSQTHSEYANSINQLETQEQNLKLAQSIYNTTLIKYSEGVGGSLEVSNAQTELFTTQQNYVQALYDVLVAKSSLNKAISN